MFKHDFDAFAQLLDDAYVFQKSPLNTQAKAVFFRAMAKYPFELVASAVQAHLLDPASGQYAMQPAHLMAQIEKLGDGRPGAEEAWAIALTSRDESETVVWTQEMAEAFATCQSVLQTGDEVGARMAFKEAYQRLVGAAKRAGEPVRWMHSIGWCNRKREAALTKAANAGLLPHSTVKTLCISHEGPAPHDEKAREQISKIKQMMADMNAEKYREMDLHFQRERQATQSAKDRLNAQVANYSRRDAA